MFYCIVDAANASPSTPSSQQFPSISLAKVASGLDEPTDIANAGDGTNRLFILEKSGRVRIIKNGKILPAPFLDIKSLVKSSGSEQGLLGIAFPPRFKEKGYFYVHYTNRSGVGNSTVPAIASAPMAILPMPLRPRSFSR